MNHQTGLARRDTRFTEEDPHVVSLGLAAFDVGRDAVVPGRGDELHRRVEIFIVEVRRNRSGHLSGQEVHTVGLPTDEMGQKHFSGHRGLDLPGMPRVRIVGAVHVGQAAEESLEEDQLVLGAPR